MLAGYDFHGAVLESEVKKHKELEKIDLIFQKMREELKKECNMTREMMREKFDKLDNIMDKSLRLLYSKASSSVKKTLEARYQRMAARMRKLESEAITKQKEPEDITEQVIEDVSVSETQSEGESGDMALEYGEEEECNDFF